MGKIFEVGYQNYPADPAKAVKYYRQAAESGHILALRRMVDICNKGELEQKKSDTDAAYWLDLLDADRD